MNFIVAASENQLADRFADWFVAHIDGQKANTLRQFYQEMADVLEIPDFGFNLDALNDSLNDLQWLDDEQIVLYFTNTTDLVARERDPAKFGSVLNMLDATAEDWKWVEADELTDPKQLMIVFQDSPRIREVLDKEGIAFEEVA